MTSRQTPRLSTPLPKTTVLVAAHLPIMKSPSQVPLPPQAHIAMIMSALYCLLLRGNTVVSWCANGCGSRLVNVRSLRKLSDAAGW